MKQTMLPFILGLALVAVVPGCSQKNHDGKPHAEDDHSHNADGSHSDSAQSFSGATHKDGTGITLLEETRKLLGIQTAEVQEQTLPRTIRFTARVFDGGRLAGDKAPSSSPLALGTVSTNDAILLRPGLPVNFNVASGNTVTGAVQRVSQLLASGEAEVIAALSTTTTTPQQGDFGQLTISVPGEKATLVVPREAVIRGTTGDLVYAVNGDAYTLTWVEIGTEANGMMEITDGLFAGDSVVTRGAMDLWLVELRAVKGGQGCCPAPPKKGKG
jgi:hypothetical protein